MPKTKKSFCMLNKIFGLLEVKLYLFQQETKIHEAVGLTWRKNLILSLDDKFEYGLKI